MGKIPVQFSYKGKPYQGILEAVQGGGSNGVFHLMVNNFYWGRLRNSNNQWVFDPTPKTEDLKTLTDYFASTIIETV